MELEAVITQVAQTIQKEANISAVFGEPKKLDEHTIIPVARVKITISAGGGMGSGPETTKAGGAGGGGALLVEVEPIGFIRDGAEGPMFKSIAPEGLLGKVEHLLDKKLSGGAAPP